jgi:hypothetical protein
MRLRHTDGSRHRSQRVFVDEGVTGDRFGRRPIAGIQ